jgi:hypothetical protein
MDAKLTGQYGLTWYLVQAVGGKFRDGAAQQHPKAVTAEQITPSYLDSKGLSP